MTGLLRGIRVLVGVFGSWQVIGVFNTVMMIANNPGEDLAYGYLAIYLAVKIVAALIALGAFLGLHALINKLYEKKYRIPHPRLSKSRWAI